MFHPNQFSAISVILLFDCGGVAINEIEIVYLLSLENLTLYSSGLFGAYHVPKIHAPHNI